MPRGSARSARSAAVPPALYSAERRARSLADGMGVRLVKQIDLCQIDDFVAPPTENCFEHEEAEAGHLLEADRRRHGEFLSRYGSLDQSRAVVLERLSDHRPDLLRRFGPQTQKADGFSHLGEIRVVKVGGEIEDAGRLHLQFDKR